MGKTRLTTRLLESLPSKEKRYNIFDAEVRHLGLACHPSGARTWFHLAKVLGLPKRTTIGPWPDLSLEMARGKAQEINAALSKWKLNDHVGPSPVDKKPGEPTFGELFSGYLTRHLVNAKNPKKAVARAQSMADTFFPSWKNRKAGSIRSKDVKDLYGEISARIGRNGQRTRHTANRVLQLIRAVFFWAIEAEVWTGKNPASKTINKKTGLFREPKRDRFLNSDELARLFRALQTEPNPDVRDFVFLSLWTGARKTDTLSMEWDHVLPFEDNSWRVPATTKGGVPYTVPLTIEAIAILKDRLKYRTENERWVFPGCGMSGHAIDFKRRWKELLKRAGIENLRQHDLRRTLGSVQAQQGASLSVIGKSLGHQSLAATQVYARLELDNVRESVATAVTAMAIAMKKKPKQLAAGRG